MADGCSRDANVHLLPSVSALFADDPVTIFIDSNLGTHLALPLSPHDTVEGLKRSIGIEHPLCFPSLGKISVHALKVKRKGHLYHLSNSMLVRSAFNVQTKTWVLHMDASAHYMPKCQEELEQGIPTSQIEAQVQMPESLEVGISKRIDQTSGTLIISADKSEDMKERPLPLDHTFEDLLLPMSSTKKERKRKTKDSSIAKVEKEPLKDDDEVGYFQTKKNPEVEKVSPCITQEGIHVNADKSNCILTDDLNDGDVAKSKKKRKNVPKVHEAGHDSLGSVEGKCSGKNCKSLVDDIDTADLDDENNRFVPHDESKLPSLKKIDDQKGLSSWQLVEPPSNSKSEAEKKRKNHKRIKHDIVDNPSDNHQNDSLVDYLPSISDAPSVINCHGGVTNKSYESTQRENPIFPGETKGMRNAKSGNETLVSRKERFTDEQEMDSLGKIGILGAKVGIVSKENKRKKPKKAEAAVSQELTVPHDEVDNAIAPNISLTDHEHTELINNRNICNDEDVSKKKDKRSREKVKNVDLEMSRSNSQLLSSSMRSQKHVGTEKGLSDVSDFHAGTNYAVTSIPTYDCTNVIESHEDMTSDTIELTQKGKASFYEETMDTRNERSGSQTLASMMQPDMGAHEMVASMKVTYMDTHGTEASRKNDIVPSEVGMVSKEKRKNKSKKAEAAVAKGLTVPHDVVDNVIAPNILLTGHEHTEPLNGTSICNDEDGKMKKDKRSRGKVKNEVLETSRSNSQLFPSVANEKFSHSDKGSLKLLAGTNYALIPTHDGMNAVDSHGNVTSNSIESTQREKTILSEKTVDIGNVESISETVLPTKGTNVDAHEREAPRNVDIVGADAGVVLKENKKKKAKKAEADVAKGLTFPHDEVNNVVAPNISLSVCEHAEIVKKNISNDDGMKKKEKRSRGKVKNVDLESRSNSQVLPSLMENDKCEHTEQESSKMHAGSNYALISVQSQEKDIDSNVQSDYESSPKDNEQRADGFSNSPDRVNDKEISHLKKDPLNFIDYFKAGLSNDENVHPDENLPSRKRTKKESTEKDAKKKLKSVVTSNESDALGKAHDDHHQKQKNVDLANTHTAILRERVLAGECERLGDVSPGVQAQGPFDATATTDVHKSSRADHHLRSVKEACQHVANHGATNHEMSSKGRDTSVASDATTAASTASISASIYSDDGLSSADSEAESPNPSSSGYLLASRENVGSIGRKMMQTIGSVTTGKLSDIFKSASSCRKAKLQASSSQPEQMKIDDTDGLPADVVMETQTDI